MPSRIASKNKIPATVHCALKEMLKSSDEGSAFARFAESDPATAIRGNERFGSIQNHFSTELEGVLAAQNRHLVQNVQAAVGSSVLWPIAPQAESAKSKGVDPNDRGAE